MNTHHLLTRRIQVGSRETIALKEYHRVSCHFLPEEPCNFHRWGKKKKLGYWETVIKNGSAGTPNNPRNSSHQWLILVPLIGNR